MTCLLVVGAELGRRGHLINLDVIPAGDFCKMEYGDGFVVTHR